MIRQLRKLARHEILRHHLRPRDRLCDSLPANSIWLMLRIAAGVATGLKFLR
jgi:hypothetical protein